MSSTEPARRDTAPNLAGLEESPDRTGSAKAIRAASIGTLLEYYDFGLYASAASIVFGSVFFSGASPALATLQAVATFSIGFLVRPVGGVILGILGDRLGRKRILVFTLVIMGLATMLVGFVPSYEQIGWVAPAALVLLRIAQGIGASAEYGGAVLVSVEFAPEKRRGLLGSLPGAGAGLGGVLGSAALLITSAVLPDDAFMTWGWRIPFLFSGAILAYGLWLRTNLEETPTFRSIEQSNAKARNPFKEVIRQQPRSLVTIAVMLFSQSGIAYFYQVFMLTFATNQLGMERTETFTGLIIAQVSCTILIPIFGMASDSVGRRPVIMFGFVFSALLAFPVFWLLGSTDIPGLLWLIMFLGNGIGVAAIYGPMGTYITELFNARHAYTGLGLGRETGNSLGAALVPVLAVQLAFNDSGSTWALSLLLVVIAVFGAFAVQASIPRNTTAGVDDKRDGRSRVDVARRDV